MSHTILDFADNARLRAAFPFEVNLRELSRYLALKWWYLGVSLLDIIDETIGAMRYAWTLRTVFFGAMNNEFGLFWRYNNL